MASAAYMHAWCMLRLRSSIRRTSGSLPARSRIQRAIRSALHTRLPGRSTATALVEQRDQLQEQVDPGAFRPCLQCCCLSWLQSHSEPDMQVSGRRLQSYGGSVHDTWGGLLKAPMPGWLQARLTKIDKDFQLYSGPANHVLVNAYEPGQGIMVSLYPLMRSDGCQDCIHSHHWHAMWISILKKHGMAAVLAIPGFYAAFPAC